MFGSNAAVGGAIPWVFGPAFPAKLPPVGAPALHLPQTRLQSTFLRHSGALGQQLSQPGGPEISGICGAGWFVGTPKPQPQPLNGLWGGRPPNPTRGFSGDVPAKGFGCTFAAKFSQKRAAAGSGGGPRKPAAYACSWAATRSPGSSSTFFFIDFPTCNSAGLPCRGGKGLATGRAGT